MLDRHELKLLSDWCHAQGLRWRPRAAAPALSLLLEPLSSRRGWQGMILTLADDFELATEFGEPLATASDLHSLLDALDAGVAASPLLASPPVPARRRDPTPCYA